MNKDKNFYLITIDGLDASGKETISKSIYDIINHEVVEKNYLDCNISLVSFPRYETEIGKEIKHLLSLPQEQRDKDKLRELFIKDREDFFKTYWTEIYNEDKMNVLICDRYNHANLIYDFISTINIQDTIRKSIAKSEIIDKFMEESKRVPKPDLTLIFNRVDFKSKEIHRKLLSLKRNKDKNETEFIQQYLSTIINEELMDVISNTSNEVLVIPIGSNFDNTKIETSLAQRIIAVMVRNKTDNIIYPPKRKLNGASIRFREKNIAPSVIIKFKPNYEDKNLIKVFNDMKVHFIDKIIQSYNNLIASNISNKNQLIIPITILKNVVDSKINEIENLIKNGVIGPVYIPFVRLLMEEIYSHLVFNSSNYMDPINEDIVRECVTKVIYNPRKLTQLSSTYNVFAPFKITLKPREIKEINLAVLVKSIEGITKETKHSILDIDIRTSKECVLKYGVSVADSPSTLPCDTENDELSIVLINNSDNEIIIPTGTPIASMIIKRSSCETIFKIITQE